MDSICAAMDGGRESIMDQKKNKTDQDEKQEKKMGIYFLLTLVALGLLFAGINIWSENYYCDYPNCFNKATDGKGRCELHTLAINGSLIRDDIRHGRINWDKIRYQHLQILPGVTKEQVLPGVQAVIPARNPMNILIIRKCMIMTMRMIMRRTMQRIMLLMNLVTVTVRKHMNMDMMRRMMIGKRRWMNSIVAVHGSICIPRQNAYFFFKV